MIQALTIILTMMKMILTKQFYQIFQNLQLTSKQMSIKRHRKKSRHSKVKIQ